MALVAQKGGKGESKLKQQPIEPDVYPGRLVQVIDLGLQKQRPYQGQEKPPANEIMLTYELVDTFIKDEDGNDVEDKPRWISETIPFHSLSADKAKSTKRYYVFDPDGVYGGDFSKCVAAPCNVTVVHNKSGEKLYVNIGDVTPMRKRDADKLTQLANPAKVFDLDDPDMEIFGSLPEWIQDKIKNNLRFKGSRLESIVGEQPDKKEEVKQESATEAVTEDDIPW